jgi:hypothetical protein
MNTIDKLVYSSVIRKIDEYILSHKGKPEKIIMNEATNKKLVSEIHGNNNDTVLEINVIFGMEIIIKNFYRKRELYNNEIIILGR